MIKNCLVCEKEFITYPCLLKVGKGKYCSKECCLSITNNILSLNGIKTRFNKGQIPHNYKGWRYKQSRKNGRKYKEMFIPTHPNSTNTGYILEHRLIMENKIGRKLRLNEIVHHINNNSLDNNIDNLQLMTKKEHDSLTYDSYY